MRVLLISTYELGRQPIHLASPAASLRRAGHEVRTLDLAIEELTDEHIDWPDRLAISVPMHTATRLADQVVTAVGRARPDLPVAIYGLYAGAGSAPVAVRLEGEYEPGLAAWLADEPVSRRHLGRSAFVTPDRSGLVPLDRYARLEHEDRAIVAGAVETSHGCRHRCRHCPIPAVYDGRIRVVPKDQVLADIGNLVTAGAGHITFGDADFLNAPAHSVDILEQAHRAHPDLTFDATIKVTHIVDHADLWPRLAEANLLFTVSAFESVDDRTLGVLDKGHTVADLATAVDLVRAHGVHIRPTWLPFMPWTTPEDVAEILEFIDRLDLAAATDPVQLSIRLLIPRGSLLEDHPEVRPFLDGYDDHALTWRWEFAHPETAVLHKELETIAANASDCGQESIATLDEMRSVVAAMTGRSFPQLKPSANGVPRLTESWFCCAEPTHGQTISIRTSSR